MKKQETKKKREQHFCSLPYIHIFFTYLQKGGYLYI
ncbi:hypothetical protein M6B38_260745 [Iris pallida]|uniref:Uncharacterized protein n=1 Tax=Iris pallida TaxID=29817 RepID=A0AAX6ID02_IRIPA|nr:hypothetical protein M6B38_167855 [Iris pallida]KAJ6851146.1 hypothetical protein M6B38_260745 [Iris pallida]